MKLHFTTLASYKAPSTLCWGNLKKRVSFLNLKRIKKCFQSTLRCRNSKTQQLLFILDLCLRNTRAVKSHNQDNNVEKKGEVEDFSQMLYLISPLPHPNFKANKTYPSFAKTKKKVTVDSGGGGGGHPCHDCL